MSPATFTMSVDGSPLNGTLGSAFRSWPRPGGFGTIGRPGRDAAAYTAALDFALDQLRLTGVERLLAVTRLVAAIVLAVAMAADIGPLHPPAAKLLLAGYVVYAVAVLALVWRRVVPGTLGALALHWLDLAWATAATSLSGGTSSIAFPLFAFILAAAAYRWGLHRTLVDGAVVTAVASAQGVTALAGMAPWPFDLDLFVMRVSSIVILGVLFGVLSERRNAISAHAAAVGRMLTYVGRGGDVRSAIGDALDGLLRLFGASEALLVVHEFESRRLYLWRATPRPGTAASVSQVEIPAEDRERWFFPLPSGVEALEARPGRAGEPASVSLALDADGGFVEGPFAVAPAIPISRPWRSSTAAVIEAKKTLEARLFVLDAVHPRRREARLAALQSLVRQVSPALVNLYLVRRVRSRAGSRERVRLACELHDGVIQTLAALEMRLELVRRRAASADAAVAAEVASARDLLHEEALRARELMEGLRPAGGDAERLSIDLAGMVERFSHTTGIDARLDVAEDRLDLTPRESREILRIVQEALVNVRRHSGASHVVVGLAGDAVHWGLTIEDDGRGLGFTGRLAPEQVDREQAGPRIIRERVAALGGTLGIGSSPSGLRLELRWPRARRP